MKPKTIIDFKFCLNNTYFVFNRKIYKQIYGLAIGARMSGFAAEILWRNLKR